MNNKHNPSAEAAAISTGLTGLPLVESVQALRKRADEISTSDVTITKETLSPEETQQLQHELRVCQTDLKMQNEELRRTKEELEALRKRLHDRYFDLYDLAPVGYFTLSEQGMVLEANLTATTMLGVSRGSLVRQSISRFILPEDLDTYRIHCNQSVESGVRQAWEMRILSSDGSSFWAHLQLAVALDDNHTPVYMVTLEDIDQRKQAEEEVHREKALLRCLIDSVGDLIFIKDVSGVYIACNKASEEFIGLPECEQIGKTDFDFFDRDMAEAIREHDRQILASGKESRKEEWVTFRDGRRGLLDTLKAPFYGPDGEQLGLVGISRDISERKRVEDALRESEERFRTLCDSAPIGIFLSDSEGNNIYCNPRWEEISGMSAAEGRGTGWKKAIHPDDREEISKIWLETFSTDCLYCHEHRQLTPQGKTIWVRALAAPVKNPEGAILGHVGTVEDITELRHARQEMLKTQKLESLGVLAGGIAHDFNNILTAILGNISLARLHMSDQEKVAKRLDGAEMAAIRAKDLAQQLLTFARGGEPVKKIIELNGILREAADFALHGSNARCKFALADDLWTVEADEGQLVQVIHNLVLNAAQAMPEGGTVTVSASNVSFSLKGKRFVKISVSDTGAGISEQHLQKIFDPYFTTKQQGIGLGLATSYSIIKKHGGNINAASILGNGSTFTIYLPASLQKSVSESYSQTTVFHGSSRILVMDDDAIIRELAQAILGELGYTVECVENGSEAVDLFLKRKEQGTPFSAVILDLTIPGGVGGKEVIAILLKLDPNIKAIVSSGYSSDPVMANYRQYGFSAVLIKPYGVHEMSNAMHEFLTL